MFDYHIHTHFSSDSEEAPANYIHRASIIGLSQICFTDHYDLNYPEKDSAGNQLFVFDVDAYYEEMLSVRKMAKQIAPSLDVRIGIELGLDENLCKENNAVINSKPFDFVIGSMHIVDNIDPYYEEYWQGKKIETAIRNYYEACLRCVNSYNNYDVFGHVDYISRYIPDKNYIVNINDYLDIIECILKKIIETGHGIEINTSLTGKGINQTNPCKPIIQLYHKLGGEIITTGSDAHSNDKMASGFDLAHEYLNDCGFKYYTTFENRKPAFHKIP